MRLRQLHLFLIFTVVVVVYDVACRNRTYDRVVVDVVIDVVVNVVVDVVVRNVVQDYGGVGDNPCSARV